MKLNKIDILQNEKFILENKLRELLPKPKVTEIKKEKKIAI